MATIYYPAMTSALAWLSARYTMALFGYGAADAETNGSRFRIPYPSASLSTLFHPSLPVHFQVSTTIIKLIPLVLLAIVGTIYGIKNGVLADNMNSVVDISTAADGTVTYTQVPRVGISFNLILAGVCTSVFAYEGWVIATAINSELKDAKKNLPRLSCSAPSLLSSFICSIT